MTPATTRSDSIASLVASCSRIAGLGSSVAVPPPFWAMATAVAAAVPARRLRLTPPLICTTLTPAAQPLRRCCEMSKSVRPQLTPSVRGTGRSAVR